jgi:AraC-like DNA-binding protein
MLSQPYINLRHQRLPATEEWPLQLGRLSFVFPRDGSGQFVSGPNSHRLSPGDVLVVNVTRTGKIFGQTGGELKFSCFSVCLENLLPLFSGPEISQLEAVIASFKGARLYAASQPVAIACHRLLQDVPAQGDLGHRSQLLHIAAAILSAEFKLAHRQPAGFVSPEQHLVQVFESLSGEEILGLSMEALAARFACGRRHLNRLFHQCFGCAVATLRMEIRLLKAVSLLRDREAKVINVAEECGFNHLGLFNTCFKRRFGVAPGKWRKTNAQTAGSQPGFTGNGVDCRMRSNGQCSWLVAPGMPGPNECAAAR